MESEAIRSAYPSYVMLVAAAGFEPLLILFEFRETI